MLTEVLSRIAALAEQVADTKLGGAAAEAARHARDLSQTTLKGLRERRQTIAAFANDAGRQVATLEQRLAQNAPPAEIIGGMTSMVKRTDELVAAVEADAKAIGGIRDAFAGDEQAVHRQIAEYAATLSRLDGERQSLEAKARDYDTRLKVINTVSILMPLVKIVDEIVSLVQGGKLTEQELNDTLHRLADTRQAKTSLEAWAAQLASLRDGVARAATMAQNLGNTLSFILAQLRNAGELAKSGNAETAKLFLTAQLSFLKRLQEEVS